MTISTQPTNRKRRLGFTLVEVMIASTLSTVVLAGVLSAYLMIGRSGFSAANYSEMEAESRRGLETFAEDVRKATNIQWNGSQSITLSVATGLSSSTLVTYAYDAGTSGATAGCFYRLAGDAGSGAAPRVLVHGVASDFAFRRFRLDASDGTDAEAANDLETKLVQVTMRATRTGARVVAANQRTYSSRYLLRNKRVTN